MNPKIFWGVLLVIPFALFLIYTPPLPFLIIALIAMAMAAREWCLLTMPGCPAHRWLTAVAAVWCMMILSHMGHLATAFLVLGAALVLFYSYCLFIISDTRKAMEGAAHWFSGTAYVGILGSFLILLKTAQVQTGINWIVLLFLIVWLNDAGAFFVGRKYGRRKLFERISPKKTIEGSIGGLAASVLGAFLFNVFSGKLTAMDCIVVGLLLGITGPVGDLVESMIKRATDVKDSGNLIPGHGGMLDRADSIIFSAPFLYFFVQLRFLGGAGGL